MKTIDVQEMETHFRAILSEVASGTEVVLEENHKPIARVLPANAVTGERIPGLHRGPMFIGEDFDFPLPDEFWFGKE